MSPLFENKKMLKLPWHVFLSSIDVVLNFNDNQSNNRKHREKTDNIQIPNDPIQYT